MAEAQSRQAAEQSRLAAEQQIAISERELMLKRAEIKSETDAAAAQAAASGPLAQADRDQAILTATRDKLRGHRADFNLAMQAREESVAQAIPAVVLFCFV